MAQPSFSTKALVLRKTALGESDLILTLLGEDGSQVRAVAKGARKPQSANSSRLELFSEVTVHCAQGKNLATITDTKLLSAHEPLRWSPERTAVASVLAELLSKTTQPDLAHTQLFAASSRAFQALEEATEEKLVALCAAATIKTLSFVGFRPSLNRCVGCGDVVVPQHGVRFSAEEGGVVCPRCRAHLETIAVSPEAITWAQTLLGSTYDTLLTLPGKIPLSFEVLRLLQSLIRIHVGSSLRSLDFLFASGLF